jgi:hypothetical protein
MASCAGGLDLRGPGACGPCGSIAGGAGVLSCASKIGESSKPTEIAAKRRFMDRRLETSNSLIENQDGDVNLQVTFDDILTRHVLHPFKSADAEKSVFVHQASEISFKCRPDRELI